MKDTDLLEMPLSDIADLFLEKLNESGKNCIKADLPGCERKTEEQFILRVCLCKNEGLK